jgi:hypothetical protein
VAAVKVGDRGQDWWQRSMLVVAAKITLTSHIPHPTSHIPPSQAVSGVLAMQYHPCYMCYLRQPSHVLPMPLAPLAPLVPRATHTTSATSATRCGVDILLLFSQFHRLLCDLESDSSCLRLCLVCVPHASLCSSHRRTVPVASVLGVLHSASWKDDKF